MKRRARTLVRLMVTILLIALTLLAGWWNQSAGAASPLNAGDGTAPLWWWIGGGNITYVFFLGDGSGAGRQRIRA